MSRMVLVLSLFLLALLVGSCVQQPIEGSLTKQQLANRAQESAKIHTELAAEYFYRRQFKVAIEEVDEALDADSNYASAHNVMGLINMALNQDHQAQISFQKGIRYAPNDPEINNNFGWFLCNRYPDRMDQAISHFMVALNDPLYATPEKSYANAGVCELKRDNRAEALSFFRHALSIQPNYSLAVIGMIEIDFKNGDLAVAKSKITDFMQRSQSTPESLWLAVQIEHAIGNRLAEDSYMFQLLKHFPHSQEAVAVRKDRLK